jgi:hypothetical protein
VVSGCFNFHPSSTNNKVTEEPQEVSKVAKVKMKKVFCDLLKLILTVDSQNL